MEKKIKVLVLADSPTSATGFAQVSRNVLNRLAKTGKYDLSVIGINHNGDHYDTTEFPYPIYLAQPMGSVDMFGRYRLLAALGGKDRNRQLKPPFDLIFTIQDHFVIEGLGMNTPFAEQIVVTSNTWRERLAPENWFKWIGYFPVDSDLKENWVTRSIALPDYPVAYCEWGKSQMMKFDRPEFTVEYSVKDQKSGETKRATLKVPTMEKRISVINHGVDLNTFYRISDEERKKFRDEYFGGVVKDDTFLLVNISRNQPRKDIMRTLQVFSEFKKQCPNSHLYMHMQTDDIGGNLDEMARQHGLVAGKDYSAPVDFNSNSGYGIDIVNKIYNSADVCLTTTLGEGWGFISTEAMATKTPLVAPNITSFIDILGADVPMVKLNEYLDNGGWDEVRGIPTLAGINKTEWISLGRDDNERLRPLTNVDDMVRKLLWVKNNPKKVSEITTRAYEWVSNLSWDNIAQKWDDLFTEAYRALENERELFNKMVDVTRNEPCPCGSGKKYKHCHGGEK